MYFYEVLQSIMDEKKISISDVARLSGLTDSTVRSIIKRKNKTVALEVAFKLSKGLDVSLQRLNGETSETEAEEQQNSKVLAELYEVAKDLSEEEQLYLLDMVKALKQRLSREPK